jgi:hypothetical protein
VVDAARGGLGLNVLLHWIDSKVWKNCFGRTLGEANHSRGAFTHVTILDATMSLREPSYQTNAGLAYELLTSWLAQNIFLQYQPELQFERHNLLASG